jgi:hypothetical protein
MTLRICSLNFAIADNMLLWSLWLLSAIMASKRIHLSNLIALTLWASSVLIDFRFHIYWIDIILFISYQLRKALHLLGWFIGHRFWLIWWRIYSLRSISIHVWIIHDVIIRFWSPFVVLFRFLKGHCHFLEKILCLLDIFIIIYSLSISWIQSFSGIVTNYLRFNCLRPWLSLFGVFVSKISRFH